MRKQNELDFGVAKEDHFKKILDFCHVASESEEYILHFLPRWRTAGTLEGVVAMAGTELAGFGLTIKTREYAWLLGPRVNEQWHNLGVAERLTAMRLAIARERGLPAKTAIFENDGYLAAILARLGFSLQGGWTIAYAKADALEYVPPHLGTLIKKGAPADRLSILAFLSSAFPLPAENEALYGENFVWYPLESSLAELLGSGRVLLEIDASGNTIGVAIVNITDFPSSEAPVLELCRVWGRSTAFIRHAKALYEPKRIRWYLHGREEMQSALRFGFEVPPVRVSAKRTRFQRYAIGSAAFQSSAISSRTI